MKFALVGVGGAGSRIVNRVLDLERRSGRNLSNGNALLVNSTEPAFDAPERVPEERRVTIGDVNWAGDAAGIDGDPDRGVEAARRERDDIVRAFDLLEFHRVDAVLVAAGLAGGTGGGAGAVVLDRLASVCDVPVYALGVLPSESEGDRRALNAARSLRSFVERADNVFAFDNDAWADAPPAGSGSGSAGGDVADADATDGGAADDAGPAFDRANAELAERVVTLFAAGEFGDDAASENRMDPSDIIRTLDTGGISAIGFASTDVPPTAGVRSWLRSVRGRLPGGDDPADDEAPTDAAKINGLVRRSARSKLTLPCAVESADRALIRLSGPSRALSRKGFESGRYWLEDEADVVDVMAGDEPDERSNTLTVAIVFSNVTDVPRIDAMQAQALDGLDALDAEAEGDGDDEWERFEAAEPQ